MENSDGTLVQPAQILLSDSSQINVSKVILKQANVSSIVNNKVYLISRGCFYEQLKSQFSVDTLDRTFSMRNKDISKAMNANRAL